MQASLQDDQGAVAAAGSRATVGRGPTELVTLASLQTQRPCLERPRTFQLAALRLPRPGTPTHTSMPSQTLRTPSQVPEPPRVCSMRDRVSPNCRSGPTGELMSVWWVVGRREEPQESPAQQHGETQAPAHLRPQDRAHTLRACAPTGAGET